MLFIFGPPAVGKMTVGRAVCERSSFRLFHNHAVMEPLLEVFDHGTSSFNRLLSEFRIRVVEEAAASGTDLLITLVWALDLAEDVSEVRRYIAPYVNHDAEIAFVELVAPLAVRLDRNGTEHRLAEKRSKRDVAWSDGNVRDLDRYQLDSATAASPADALLSRHRHLRLDNSHVSPDEAAERILTWLG